MIIIMNITEVRHLLDQFASRHPEILCAYLFGSVIGNRFHAASDIDIAIALDHPLSGTEKARLQSELESLLARDVDLVDLQRSSGNILREALHGICIICRNTTIRYQLYRQLIYDREDLQPLRNLTMQLRRQGLVYGH